LPKQS